MTRPLKQLTLKDLFDADGTEFVRVIMPAAWQATTTKSAIVRFMYDVLHVELDSVVDSCILDPDPWIEFTHPDYNYNITVICEKSDTPSEYFFHVNLQDKPLLQ